MRLTPAMERYVLHWGEMGARWGVNRSVAQIHALLYLAPQPITAEEIADTLGIARSNVSMSLKELLAWGLVRRAPVRGDRRDHFEALQDNWEILTRIVEERKKREIDPTLSILRACAMEAATDGQTAPETRRRIEGLLEFMETLSGWYEQVKGLPKPVLLGLMKMGGKVARFVPRGRGTKARRERET
ncbi:MAG: MarR family transcriptional regulator [Rhodospirillaceae bacterium]|nr:MarR family transcriptional regulator [Rhodospirillaceae bacterium]